MDQMCLGARNDVWGPFGTKLNIYLLVLVVVVTGFVTFFLCIQAVYIRVLNRVLMCVQPLRALNRRDASLLLL